ncbi:hypothetical protein QFC24_006686 [Naganishia onofrii]|uniref:Uncharacterized protein n=1 Tax=Naganishia onofrii TaxID=1851511 RepID=A0ACC2X071_9TREE|nr:hypothetical protein QFC24_006686 [Naganishia onofrii]
MVSKASSTDQSKERQFSLGRLSKHLPWSKSGNPGSSANRSAAHPPPSDIESNVATAPGIFTNRTERSSLGGTGSLLDPSKVYELSAQSRQKNEAAPPESAQQLDPPPAQEPVVYELEAGETCTYKATCDRSSGNPEYVINEHEQGNEPVEIFRLKFQKGKAYYPAKDADETVLAAMQEVLDKCQGDRNEVNKWWKNEWNFDLDQGTDYIVSPKRFHHTFDRVVAQQQMSHQADHK